MKFSLLLVYLPSPVCKSNNAQVFRFDTSVPPFQITLMESRRVKSARVKWVTIVTNIWFSLEEEYHKQTGMLYSPTGQQLSWISGCAVAPSRIFHLMGLILPLHFAVLSWQGSQSSQHLFLMAMTGGLFAPIYVFSPITPWQAGGGQATLLRGWWSPLWLVLPVSCTIFFIFLDSIREEDSLMSLSLVQSVV